MKNYQIPAGMVIVAYDAMNLDIAQSEIREGYTRDELNSGIEVLSADELLETWVPENPESVGISITLSLGWMTSDKSDLFTLCVVTTDLRDEWEKDQRSRPARDRTPTIYCKYYEWKAIKLRIDRMIEKCERPTEKESWRELRKQFSWEFEGMYGADA